MAKRASGKSQLVNYLIRNNKSVFSKIFVVCPTESINKFYSNIVPSQCIQDTYDDEWIGSLLERCGKQVAEARKNSTKPPNVCLILDDCGSETRLASEKNFARLFTRGRHAGITVIMICQYLNQMPPVVRNNQDYLLTSQGNSQSLQILTEQYHMGTISKDEFVNLYHESTKDYGFLVINCSTVKNNKDINSIYGCLRLEETDLI